MELETPQYTGQKVVYFLEIKIPDGEPHQVAVFDSLSIGSSGDVEISVEEFGLAPRHGIFQVHNDILSLHNLGGSSKTTLDGHYLQHGKMYIVDKDDTLSMGELEILIRTEDISSKADFANLISRESGQEVSEEDLITNEDFDEEEKEDEVDKGPGLFARIKSYFAKKKESLKAIIPKKSESKSSGEKTLTAAHKAPTIKTKQAKKRRKTSEAGTAGFIGRLFAFKLNLLLTMNVKEFVLPLSGQEEIINNLVKKAVNLINPLILKVTEMIPASLADYARYLDLLVDIDILTFLLLFMALGLVGTLLFGVTIGHALLLISGNESLVANRLKGLIRWIISLITTPLMFLDLPCIIGKRTLKEMVSGSYLMYRFGLAKILGPLFLFPLFALVLFLFPLLQEFNHLTSDSPEEVKIISKKMKGELPFSGESSVLGLKIEARKFESREFIPVLRYSPKGHHIQLQLLDISSKNKAQVEIKGNFLNKLDLIKIGLSGNPLAFHFYKNLENARKTNTLAPMAAQEFQILIKNALSLQSEKLVDVFLSNGPFIAGLIKLRKELLTKLSLTGIPGIVFRDAGALQLIELNDTASSSTISTSVLPLTNSNEMPMWQITYKKNVKEAGADLKQMILVRPRPLSKKKLDVTERLLKENEWGPLELLDFYHFLESAEALAPGMKNRVINYYKHQCQLALSIGSDYLFTQFEGRFRSNIESLSALNTENPGIGLEALIKSLKQQLNALSAKNIKFFERGTKSAKRSLKKTSKKKSKKKTRSKRRRKSKRK